MQTSHISTDVSLLRDRSKERSTKRSYTGLRALSNSSFLSALNSSPRRDCTDKLLYHQALNEVLTRQTGNYPVTCFVSNRLELP